MRNVYKFINQTNFLTNSHFHNYHYFFISINIFFQGKLINDYDFPEKILGIFIKLMF